MRFLHCWTSTLLGVCQCVLVQECLECVHGIRWLAYVFMSCTFHVVLIRIFVCFLLQSECACLTLLYSLCFYKCELNFYLMFLALLKC